MPCHDGRDSETSEERRLSQWNQELRAKVDKLTELLCTTLSVLECIAPDGIKNVKLPVELLAWWTEHKHRDKERRLAEVRALEYKKAREEQEAKRLAFIAKMTPEERNLLGLNRSY